jgi:hypothetical protein
VHGVAEVEVVAVYGASDPNLIFGNDEPVVVHLSLRDWLAGAAGSEVSGA